MPYEPSPTRPVVVILTSPDDLYLALEQAAQQLMGMNDTNQANINAFVAWYHGQQTAFQTGRSNIEPPSPPAAAEVWINSYFPTRVEANRFLQDANSIDCMIQSGHPGPCPDTTTTWP
jgi:hypothetical protein